MTEKEYAQVIAKNLKRIAFERDKSGHGRIIPDKKRNKKGPGALAPGFYIA